jgi:hypothetical protein
MCRAYTKNTVAYGAGAGGGATADDDPFGALLDDFELYGLEGEVVADLGAVKAESGE